MRPQGKVKRSPWTSVDVTVVAYWYKVQRSGAGRGTKWDKDGRGPAVSTEMYALYSYTYRSREARPGQTASPGRQAGRAHLPNPSSPLAVPAEEAHISIKEGRPMEQVRENEGREGKGCRKHCRAGRQRGPLPRENGRRGGHGDECELYLLHGGGGHETCLVVRCVDGRR